MRIVSFDVANALKDLGYPQTGNGATYKEDGTLENGFTDLGEGAVDAPSYLEAWIWLWGEGVHIDVNYDISLEYTYSYVHFDGVEFDGDNPEDVIAAAIDYLVSTDALI